MSRSQVLTIESESVPREDDADTSAWMWQTSTYSTFVVTGAVLVPVVFLREEAGFSVVTPSHPGACAQGETREEAREAIIEVLRDFLSNPRTRGEFVWCPDEDDVPLGEIEVVGIDVTW